MKYNVIVNRDHLVLVVQLPCLAGKLSAFELVGLRDAIAERMKGFEGVVPEHALPEVMGGRHE